MPQSTDGGVRKQGRGYYRQSLQKLQAVVEAKLKEIAVLDAAREQMAEREQVLVDLVLQQEHHLSHLEQMRASLDADMANLDMLLSMDSTHVAASGNSSGALPEVAGSTGSLSTDSAAACSSGMVMTPCNGASHCSEGCAVAPAIAQLQALQQQPLQLQLQVQQWQHGSASAASDSGSNTPVGVTVSTALGDNRQQKIQRLMQSATDVDWARALTMTSNDWCAYQGRLVARLTVVLERRKQQREQQQQPQDYEAQVVPLPPSQRSTFAASVLSSDSAPAAADSLIDADVELLALIDDFTTLVNLAVLHNPMPVRDCARRSNATLEYQDVVPLEFWAEATARTGFTEEQIQQLRFGYNEYWRIMGQVHSKQQQLASSVALSLAASAPKPWGMRGGASAVTSAAAAAAATAPAQERDDLLHLLDEHMARWQTAAQLLLQFYCNTMTHEQIANMLVACWPFFPRMGSLVGAVAEADDPGAFQRLEAHMEQLRSQHAASVNRRKQQLAQQRQDYWRRLVVLREQQVQQQQLQAAVAQQQQQQQQQQQRFVMQPVGMAARTVQ